MMFTKLGEELKEAREKSEVSLQQVASKTRIDLKFLEALEQGNFSFLPELYVKAFLKEYASFVGLNVDTILKKYEYARQGKVYEDKPAGQEAPPAEELKQQEPVKQPEPPKHEEKKKEEIKPVIKQVQPLPTYDAIPQDVQNDEKASVENRKKIILASIVGGAVILIAAIYFLFFNSSSEIIVPDSPVEEATEQSQKYFEDEQQAPPPETTAADTSMSYSASGDSMHLNIFTSDTSWVKVTMDNSRVQEFFLMPNSQKTFTAAANYTVVFGRSSAVRMTLNNQPLQFTPKNKFVSKISIDSTGIKYLDTAPVVKKGE